MPTAHGPTTFVTSAARTTDGNSGGQFMAGYSKLALLVSVTAVGGTPSMALTVEWSHDKTVWATADPADSWTAITTAVAKAKVFDAKAPYYRLVWVITGGSPSLTFSASQYTYGV